MFPISIINRIPFYPWYIFIHGFWEFSYPRNWRCKIPSPNFFSTFYLNSCAVCPIYQNRCTWEFFANVDFVGIVLGSTSSLRFARRASCTGNARHVQSLIQQTVKKSRKISGSWTRKYFVFSCTKYQCPSCDRPF